MNEMEHGKQIDNLTARVALCENINRHLSDILDILSNTGGFQLAGQKNRDVTSIFQLTLMQIRRLIPFQTVAFFTIDEPEADFVMSYCDPPENQVVVQSEIDERVANGTFAWALQRSHPVAAPSRDGVMMLVLHVLSTRSRTRGMFAGFCPASQYSAADPAFLALSIVLNNSASALESCALYELLHQKNERLEEEVSRAYRYIINEQGEKLRNLQVAQQSMLVRPEDLPDGNFAVFYKSLHEAGGDFYDVIKISDGIFGYFVADISGHDLGSSFVTAALKALIRQSSSLFFTASDTVKMMNIALIPIMAEGQHLTASYVHADMLRERMTIISAGHPAILYLDSRGKADYLDVKGDILGVFESVYLESEELLVSKGDRIFLYTDGLIEGFGENRKQRDKGKEELKNASIATRHLPLKEAVDEMVNMIIPDGAAIYDDLLLMGVEI